MNIFIINGCEKENLLGEKVTQRLCDRIAEKGVSHSTISLNTFSLKPCISCDACHMKKPGSCMIEDGLNEILKQYLASDLAFIITPIVYGSCNSLTKTFLDRTQPLYMPYQKPSANIMAPRYSKYPDFHMIGLANDSALGIDNFKETFLHCTLALQSKKTSGSYYQFTF